jgi:hypothetical protein
MKTLPLDFSRNRADGDDILGDAYEYPPTGKVKISAPLRMELDTIRVFAVSKLSWNSRRRSQLRNVKRREAIPSGRATTSGENATC